MTNQLFESGSNQSLDILSWPKSQFMYFHIIKWVLSFFGGFLLNWLFWVEKWSNRQKSGIHKKLPKWPNSRIDENGQIYQKSQRFLLFSIDSAIFIHSDNFRWISLFLDDLTVFRLWSFSALFSQCVEFCPFYKMVMNLWIRVNRLKVETKSNTQ